MSEDNSSANFRADVAELRKVADESMGNLWTDLWTVTLAIDEPSDISNGDAQDLTNAYQGVIDTIVQRHWQGLDVIEASKNALHEIATVYAIADGQD